MKWLFWAGVVIFIAYRYFYRPDDLLKKTTVQKVSDEDDEYITVKVKKNKPPHTPKKDGDYVDYQEVKR